jgi:hypothetical protein
MSGNIYAGEVNSFVVVLLLSVYYYFYMNKTCWEQAKDVYNDILANTVSSDESELII